MKCNKPILGFLIAPIAPSLLFAISALVMGASSDIPLELPLSGYVLGLFIWFLYGIVVAYPATLVIGIPGYLIYKNNNLTSLKSYVIGGTILGALAPLLLMPIFGIPETLNFNYWVFLISSVFGAVTCATFWLVAIKNPNKAFKRDSRKSVASPLT